jgi:hypothetical protein
MAINPETQFTGKITPSSPDYPYGEARNVATPGDGTGTPWLAVLVNDLFGWQQALLSEAGIVPSGNPDKVGASQYVQAITALVGKKFDTVAAMVADTGLRVGDNVGTLGYYAIGDGGGNYYTIVAAATGTDDGGSFIDLSTHQAQGLFLAGVINIKQFGAKGDGATDDSVAIQAAIDFGGQLFAPVGTYMAEGLGLADNFNLVGEDSELSIIKLVNNSTLNLLNNPDQVTDTVRLNIKMQNITFDGNAAQFDITAEARSVVSCSGVDGFTAKKCNFINSVGYGLAFQAIQLDPGAPSNAVQKNIKLEDCLLESNGIGTNFSVDTFDGLDIKEATNVQLIGCRAISNEDKGFDIRGTKIVFSDCEASLNKGSSGFGLSGNTNGFAIPGEFLLNNCIADGNLSVGFLVTDGSNSSTEIVTVLFDNCIAKNNAAKGIYCVVATAAANIIKSEIVNCVLKDNGEQGVRHSVGNISALISNTKILDNTLDGIWSECEALQISNSIINGNDNGFKPVGSGKFLVSNTTFENNTLESIVVGATLNLVTKGCSDVAIHGPIASAATLPISPVAESYFVTGTTDISDFANKHRGRQITLHFTGVLNLIHGTLRLPGGVNLAIDGNDICSFISDNSNWFLISHSANS